MRIGVCIPCHGAHTMTVEKAIASMEAQTRKPDVVALSISGTTFVPELQGFSFPIHIDCTREKRCAGANRNNAAEMIADKADILFFFDADDLMHPQCIEIGIECFQKGSLDVFLHARLDVNSSYKDRPLHLIDWVPTKRLLHTNCFRTSKDYICGRVEFVPTYQEGIEYEFNEGVCNGHVAVTTETWKKEKCLEDYGIGEDSEYVYQLYMKNYNIGFCNDRLSYYIH